MLDLIASWPGAVLLRQSSLAYLLVNASHIVAIGLIIGPILALDLRLLGAFSTTQLPLIGPFLAGAARVGVALVVPTGIWLFSVQPENYVTNPAFLAKLALLLLAIGNALLVDFSLDWRAAMAGRKASSRLRLQAALSIMLWLSTLVAGRWIGFV